MKLDRGIIKWQPFNSVTPSSSIINKIIKEKQKINKPILSEEQFENIQNSLLEAYNNEIQTNIEYYKNGIILKESTIIKILDLSHNRIILNTNKIIYFNQIIKITN